MSNRYDLSWSVRPQFYYAPFPERDDFSPKLYQHSGVEYALGRDHCIIGDAPGIGKSGEAVMISNAISSTRNLIVCPASLRLNWQREVWLWSTTPNVEAYVVLPGNTHAPPDNGQYQYTILSYDALRNEALLEALLMRRWDHLILDEGHYLKDPKGNKRTKAVVGWHPDQNTFIPGLTSVSGRISLLTGSLMPNQPKEAYNAIRMVNHEAINCASLDEFVNFYYAEGSGMIRAKVQKTDEHGNPYTTSEVTFSNKVRNVPRNLRHLRRALRENCMVRRLKTQPGILDQLPPKQWHPFPLVTDTHIRKALRHPGWKKAERLYALGDMNKFQRAIAVDGSISTARRELGEAKAPRCAEYIFDLLDGGVECIVVAAFHNTTYRILKEKLSKKYKILELHKGMSNPKRQLAVDLFQNDDQYRVILGQNSIIGLGWTLTRAQDVVITEPDWVPGNNDQILDRVNRLGQTGLYTLGHIPVVPDTLDEKILGDVTEKDATISTVLDLDD